MEQPEFQFEYPERTAMAVEHPLVILSWKDLGDGAGKVEAYWPDFNIASWFRNWREALPQVLHEANGHVRVKVRP